MLSLASSEASLLAHQHWAYRCLARVEQGMILHSCLSQRDVTPVLFLGVFEQQTKGTSSGTEGDGAALIFAFVPMISCHFSCVSCNRKPGSSLRYSAAPPLRVPCVSCWHVEILLQYISPLILFFRFAKKGVEHATLCHLVALVRLQGFSRLRAFILVGANIQRETGSL